MEPSTFPPPSAWAAPRQPAVPPPPAVGAAVSPVAVPQLPVATSPVAGLSAAQWQMAREEAARFHAVRQASAWATPTQASAPQRPSRSHRRRAVAVSAVALVAMVAAATATVVLRDQPAEAAFSLDAATSLAEQANTVSYEYTTTMPDGTAMQATVDLDLDRGLSEMTMDAGFGGDWHYIIDIDAKRMYVASDSYDDLVGDVGLDVGDADWIAFDLDDLLDTEDMQMMSEIGQNPLDATLLFDVADSVDDLGFDDVHGERVKHYEVTIDEDVSIGSSLHANAFVNDGEVDPVGKDVYDVYVNESNMIVELSYEYEFMGSYISMDLTVTGTNEPMHIEVPKSSDVVESGDMGFDV